MNERKSPDHPNSRPRKSGESNNLHGGIAPNSYYVEKVDFIYSLNNRPQSTKGFIIGARTENRFSQKSKNFIVPGPGEYEAMKSAIKQNFKPFSSAAKRFTDAYESLTPGIGTYNCVYNPCRRVQYKQSFGGNPVNLPCITQRSSIESNTDKLSSTKDEKRYNRKLSYLKLFY